MTELTDHELLADFTRTASEAAFAGLVARHVNLVYATALRYTGSSHAAEEITQAVFIILARKAGGLSRKIVLSGWLYQTARLTAANFVRGEMHRQQREQEAYMQSTMKEDDFAAWKQVAPLLDEAMGRLGETDRNAVVLRYFENKTAQEVGAALKLTEAAAHKRVNRALEKLRKIFTKRGVTLTAVAIGGAVAANSVQAAPAGLAVMVTAAAKGAGVSASTLTLIKGALKIMAWTKVKMAVVVGAGVLLAAGTTPLVLKQIEEHRTYSWQVPKFNYLPVDAPTLLAKTTPQVRIVPSKFAHRVEGTPFTQGVMATMKDGVIVVHTNQSMSIGLGVTADQIISVAYSADGRHLVMEAELPKGRYDFIANLPHGALQVLQEEIRKKFGLTGIWKPIQTNAFAVILANPGAGGFKPATGFGNSLGSLMGSLQNIIAEDGTIVVDQTGLTNRYDFTFRWPQVNTASETGQQAIKDALYEQLGLEIVPTNMPIEMLVVEKVK